MRQPQARLLIDSNFDSDCASHSEGYEPPSLEVISLDCEISSYAPDDGDTPLF